MEEFRNANFEGSGAWRQFIWLFVSKQLSKTSWSRLMTKGLGLSAEFAQWQLDNFSNRIPTCVTREQVWKKMLGAIDEKKPVIIWEFGVAWGYSSKWWLERITQENLRWHGFDRFTGLPRAWRDYEVGAFDNGGIPPAILDKRVTWHVGDVETTLPLMNIERETDTQWVILFDLDLYEPTKYAYNYLKEFLRPGDLLYFDEAFDDDERRVLNEDIVNNSEIKFSLHACNPISLALRIEG